MQQSFTTESLQKLFTFPFQDEKWKEKFLIGSLVMLPSAIIPIVPAIFVYGYFAEIMRRIIVENQEPSLPEWDEWGKKFKDGFKLFILGFVMFSPIFLLMIASQGLMMLGPFATETQNFDTNSENSVWAITLFASIFGGMGMMGIALIVSTLLGFLSPIVFGHVIAKDSISAAFKVKEWWAIFRANILGYVVTYLVIMFTSFILMFIVQVFYLTVIFCCLIPFVLSPITVYLSVIAGTAYAETYNVSKSKLGAS